MKRKPCPICNKRMFYNQDTKEWHCLPRKINNEKREGCGYIWSPSLKSNFYTYTKGDKENVLKSLGGKIK